MTSARSLRLPKTRASSDARELAVWTFADVENAEAVRAAVRDGTLECAVLDARAIASLACVELAAYKAALACERGAMVTRAVHSELVFCLSPTRHISEAFRRFGGDENTRALIVCKFDANGGRFRARAKRGAGRARGVRRAAGGGRGGAEEVVQGARERARDR